ncbi:MAG TPA: hypothetical protein VG148_10845 [Pyrinomonadaceae bacterium]|nr:hypothetical protein [Pyrinomonadaceae bacterium]
MLPSFLPALTLCLALLAGSAAAQEAPAAQGPLTSQELRALLLQLPKRQALRQEIISEVRRRGINFRLTNGLLSFVATKSGNDAELRRALEEAERRFLNPESAAPAPPEEAAALLEKTRAATLEAAEAMPDFVVRQLITRSYAQGRTQNWRTADRLTVGVSYRVEGGEQYRLLTVNGMATPPAQAESRRDYANIGGTSSTGEFVTSLRSLFAPESRAEFKPLGTDTLRGRRTVVYEYEVKRANSNRVLTYNNERGTVAGYRGKLWVDRELARVLRVESDSTEIPEDFPITASSRHIDYEWVRIEGQGEYLLPSRAVLVMTVAEGGRLEQHRNDIRFRNYQKYGTEIRIIEDDVIEDEPPQKP